MYTVMMANHGRYQEEMHKHAEVEELFQAVALCQQIVDEFLTAELAKGALGAEELFRRYTMFGDDPYIVGPEPCGFSSWTYAKGRCFELCRA